MKNALLMLAGMGLSGCAVLNLLDDPNTSRPTVEIIAPLDGEMLEADLPVHFEAQITDRKDPLEDVTLIVSSKPQGVICKVTPGLKGLASCDATLEPGRHRLSFRAKDAGGRESEVKIGVQVGLTGSGDTGMATGTGDTGGTSTTGGTGAASTTGDTGAASTTGDTGAASTTGDTSTTGGTGAMTSGGTGSTASGGTGLVQGSGGTGP